MTIRVAIIDDHDMVRAGLRLMLEGEANIEVVGEAADGESGMELVKDKEPDVILMDVTMPGMNGIEATTILKQELPETAILALTIHEGQEYFFQMLQAGASGYVPKRAAPEILLQAIETVAQGQVFIEPGVAQLLVADYIRRVEAGDEKDKFDGLTAREQEVLKHIAQDYNNQEIANQLSISAKTVQRHRENIMRKLDLHTRTELVKYAIRKGLIQLRTD